MVVTGSDTSTVRGVWDVRVEADRPRSNLSTRLVKALVMGRGTHESQKSGFARSTRANQEEGWEGGIGCGSVDKEVEKDRDTEDEEGCYGNYEWRRAHEEGDKAVGVSPGHDDD